MTLDPEIIEVLGDVDFDVDEMRAHYRRERDRRLRKDGIAQFVEVTAARSDYAGHDHFAPPDPGRDAVDDEVDAVVIGGGFGGLLAGVRLRQRGLERVRIIDSAADFGGVWYWNRYPGCQCDVESYIYLPLLEETGYVPTERYASAQEIQRYATLLATTFGLDQHALLRTAVTDMVWDESNSRWVVGTDRGDRCRARFVVHSNGPINKPKLPGIDGVLTFQGHMFHSSRWDFHYTGGDNAGGLTKLHDKRVGIIGTGASAVQAIPHLAEWAQHLYVFQRTPAMVGVRDNRPTDQEWFRSLPAGWYEARRDNFNDLAAGVDPGVDLVDDQLTQTFRRVLPPVLGRVSRAIGRRLTTEEASAILEIESFRMGEELRQRVEDLVDDRETAEALKPWYRMLCKRPCPSDTYLQTFNRENVTLVDTGGCGVDAITPDSVVADGQEYTIDCLIFASGFEVGTPFGQRAGYEVLGCDGLRLSEKWKAGPVTYQGMFAHDFPNTFFMGTTQTAHNPNVTHMLDEQATHLAYVVGSTIERGARAVEATTAAEDEWVAEIHRLGRRNSFDAECTPSYYTSEGDIENPWGIVRNRYGGGVLKFRDLLRKWRAEDALAGLVLR
jgi:cation diffusion facilitator CzcD-associated flavoprotein CzcO